MINLNDRRTGVLNSSKTHGRLPSSPDVRKKRLSQFMQSQLPEHLLIHLVIPSLVDGDLESKSMHAGQIWFQSIYPVTVYGVQVYPGNPRLTGALDPPC
ncbi:hypothetical protein EHF33_19970 (plasmid) [Deinococcus psychrotolerans]|uniref:Uncharacterized protein n=1 Tax=Deinococcus psychrotolerans TaxID=2489213 RepID=A0A3G8YIW8_9DEIO|nr:hypothetical protein [Deinococcus psychrotolerans]AZI45192.1 hypothetical protein EHF33_19970 [Deinococcus psychrotolerans]